MAIETTYMKIGKVKLFSLEQQRTQEQLIYGLTVAIFVEN